MTPKKTVFSTERIVRPPGRKPPATGARQAEGVEGPSVATPEVLEPVERDVEDRRVPESAETDIAPDLVDADMPEERAAEGESCSLPDEEATKASDLG
jgi:hypothetical protein